MSRNVEFGVFLPVGYGGFVMSTNRPDTPGTYEFNKQIAMLAEQHGLHLYAPVIVKYRDEKTDAATALEEALR